MRVDDERTIGLPFASGRLAGILKMDPGNDAARKERLKGEEYSQLKSKGKGKTRRLITTLKLSANFGICD
jgi:hypothetical protein